MQNFTMLICSIIGGFIWFKVAILCDSNQPIKIGLIMFGINLVIMLIVNATNFIILKTKNKGLKE
jgi:hypothetical protein